jgi:hypothetical protein
VDVAQSETNGEVGIDLCILIGPDSKAPVPIFTDVFLGAGSG